MWKNKKFPKREFKGRYVKLSGDRVFELFDSRRSITFESPWAAKALGWVKFK